MTKTDPRFHFHRSVIALAVCAAFVPAHGQTTGATATKAEATVAADENSKKTELSVTLGLGGVSGGSANRSIFNQYNILGLNGDNAVGGILGFDYVLHDPENSNSVYFRGANLLDDSRELGLVWRDPGEWKFSATYGELVHQNPYTFNTGLVGAGSTTPQVVALPGGVGTGNDAQLQTKRTAYGLGFNKWISPALQFEIDLKSENKEGSVLSGIGMNCPSGYAPGCAGTTGIRTGWATLMVPEPVNSNQSQVEARLNYAAESLRLSVSYYGSFYRNNNGTLNPSVPGSLNNPLGTLLPLSTGLQPILNLPQALAPDNQLNQLSLTGSYDLAPKTKANFKLSYAKATQNQDFASSGLTGAPTGVSNLGGQVNSTLAWLGITSRPIPKLTLQADLRYANRDDNTPIAAYSLIGASTYTNQQLPLEKTSGKLLAMYQFTRDYRGSLGVDYQGIDRGVVTPTSKVSGVSALRQQTDETGVNAELRRSWSQAFSGSIRLSSSRRDGSDWLKPNSGAGVTAVADPSTAFFSTAIFMPTLADRKQEKVKIFGDWHPDEKLSLQFSAEGGTNKYSMPTVYSLQKTRLSLFSLDVGYALSDNWNLNGYASWGQQTQDQARPAGSVMAFENTNISAGLGVTGKPMSKMEVGGNLAYVNDRNAYAQTLDTYAGADSAALLTATGGLPNITFRQAALKLFGKYEVDKNGTLGVNLIYAQVLSNDWAWNYSGTSYVYSDNTTASLKQTQTLTYLGVTYTYKF